MSRPPTLTRRLRQHAGTPQHRDALHLAANTAGLAAAGLLFWLVVTRILALPTATIGEGLAIVSLGTAVGLAAKGGLDTALVRHAPTTSRRGSAHLLRLAILAGGAVATLLIALLALAAPHAPQIPALPPGGWALALAIAGLLVVTWLQDAYFIADRAAHLTLRRNLAASALRVLLPILLVAALAPQPVALAWALALAFSVLLGATLARRLPRRDGAAPARRPFLRTATRNATGGAADFLPGLMLAPMVLALEGPEAAAHFGIAWTVAAVLFQISGAIGRSALVELVHAPDHQHAAALRRAALQASLLLAPAALGILLAPQILALFGPAYAANASTTLLLLLASVVLLAPTSLYVALLRAREQAAPLVLWPMVTLALLFTLVPILEPRMGLPGVAAAWLLANAPLSAWAVRRLIQQATEVKPNDAQPVNRRPYAG